MHLAYGYTHIHVQSSIRKQSEKKLFPKPIAPSNNYCALFYLCEIITKFYPVGEKIDLSIAVWVLTFIIGPVDGGVFVLERGVRGLNAAMLCDTPSARMNCSRSSMLVRPLAACGRRPVRGITNRTG